MWLVTSVFKLIGGYVDMTEEKTNQANAEGVEKQTEENTEQTSNEPKTFTQDELNGILEDRLNRQAKSFDKKLVEAQKKAVDDYKASIEEDKRLANMSEKDRLNEQLAQAQKEIENLKAKQQRADMLKETRHQLNAKEINVTDAVLEMIATDNAETTQENILAVETWLNDLHKEWETSRAKGRTPQSMTISNTDKTTTKEEFDRMTSSERSALFQSNPELFNKLTGGI